METYVYQVWLRKDSENGIEFKVQAGDSAEAKKKARREAHRIAKKHDVTDYYKLVLVDIR